MTSQSCSTRQRHGQLRAKPDCCKHMTIRRLPARHVQAEGRSRSGAGSRAEAGVSYAGEGAQERGAMAGEIVMERMRRVHGTNAPVRVDLVGVHSLHATALDYPTDTRDVRMRCAMRASSRDETELLLRGARAGDHPSLNSRPSRRRTHLPPGAIGCRHGDGDAAGRQSHAPGAGYALSASCCAAAFSPALPGRARSQRRR